MTISFEEIISSIRSGLTGDKEKDSKYLYEVMEKYKDHKYNKEIIKECGRLLYNLLSDEEKEKLAKLQNDNIQKYSEILKEVHQNIQDKEFNKALEILKKEIDELEKSNIYADDRVSIYRIFDEPFEEMLYEIIEKPERTIRAVDIPFTELYYLYGALLIEKKECIKSRKYLEKARHFNPVSSPIAFELMETYKITGELETFYELVVNQFKYAFRKPDIAKCYRNMGYYLIENKEYRGALSCYKLSQKYEENNTIALDELNYIYENSGEKIDSITEEDIEKYSEEFNFPINGDDRVYQIAYELGINGKKQGIYELALYCLSIAYDIRPSEELKTELEELKSDTDE